MPSAEAIAEMNKLRTDRVSAWLYEIQLEVSVDSNRWVLLTSHDEDIEFDGRTYKAYPIKHDTIDGNAAGNIGQTKLSISNIHGLAAQYLRERDGLAGKRVVLRLISIKTATDPIEIASCEAEIVGAGARGDAVAVTLGQIPLHWLRFPSGRVVRNRCRYRWFRGERCGADGTVGDPDFCDRTLDGPAGCFSHGNQRRFGGFASTPGIR